MTHGGETGGDILRLFSPTFFRLYSKKVEEKRQRRKSEKRLKKLGEFLRPFLYRGSFSEKVGEKSKKLFPPGLFKVEN